jgi:hypothetical protein
LFLPKLASQEKQQQLTALFFTFFHLECEATARRSAVTPCIVNQLYVGWSWLWSVPKMVKYLSKSKIN